MFRKSLLNRKLEGALGPAPGGLFDCPTFPLCCGEFRGSYLVGFQLNSSLMSEKDRFATQAFTNDTTQTCATQLQGDNRRVDCIHDDFFLQWTPLARMQENSLFHDLYCYIYKLKLTLWKWMDYSCKFTLPDTVRKIIWVGNYFF